MGHNKLSKELEFRADNTVNLKKSGKSRLSKREYYPSLLLEE